MQAPHFGGAGRAEGASEEAIRSVTHGEAGCGQGSHGEPQESRLRRTSARVEGRGEQQVAGCVWGVWRYVSGTVWTVCPGRVQVWTGGVLNQAVRIARQTPVQEFQGEAAKPWPGIQSPGLQSCVASSLVTVDKSPCLSGYRAYSFERGPTQLTSLTCDSPLRAHTAEG